MPFLFLLASAPPAPVRAFYEGVARTTIRRDGAALEGLYLRTTDKLYGVVGMSGRTTRGKFLATYKANLKFMRKVDRMAHAFRSWTGTARFGTASVATDLAARVPLKDAKRLGIYSYQTVQEDTWVLGGSGRWRLISTVVRSESATIDGRKISL